MLGDRRGGSLVQEQHGAVACCEIDVAVDAGVSGPVRVNNSLYGIVRVRILAQVNMDGRKREPCEQGRDTKDRGNTAEHRGHYVGWYRSGQHGEPDQS